MSLRMAVVAAISTASYASRSAPAFGLILINQQPEADRDGQELRTIRASGVLISISRSARRTAPSVPRFFAVRVDFDAIGNPYQF